MEALGHVLVALRIPFLILQFLVSAALVVAVVSQTPKSSGLGGAIGTPTTSNFKGKPGFEEHLQTWTVRAGIAWFVISILVGIAYRTV